MARTARNPGSGVTRRFLVERYLPGLALEALRRDEASIQRAARSLTDDGRKTIYLGSTFVPSEGTVLAVFEAGDAAWVVNVNRIAGVPVDRISEVVDGRGADPGPRRPRARGALAVDGVGVSAHLPIQKEDP